MKRLAVALALAASGCITDHAIAIELRPPRRADGRPDVPPEVVSYELRLYRLEERDEGCPPRALALTAAPYAQLAHAQAFDAAAGMGEAIGEIPPGRWALSAIARDGACAPLLFGCTELAIGIAPPGTLVVELDLIAEDPGCGACRSCAAGVCDPVGATCR
ncbi:MAG TPA: hypothetical protein VIL20_21625 [Sandaracinaceae bacterium]